MENVEGSLTVLVLEPDVLVRTAIAQYLRECGHKVIEGAAAEDAWQALATPARVDVVFSEVQLPGEMDGFSLASRIRQTHPEVDVILASSVVGAVEKSKELCDEGPLGKPYHPTELLTRIQRLRARRRSSKKP
jgi:DNA-binding response OmpR family regulator